MIAAASTVARPTQRLTDLLDAALQCRALIHLDTTNHPDAVRALRSWCSAHGVLPTRRVPHDSEIVHRVELPNGGTIVVTEWR